MFFLLPLMLSRKFLHPVHVFKAYLKLLYLGQIASNFNMFYTVKSYLLWQLLQRMRRKTHIKTINRMSAQSDAATVYKLHAIPIYI